MSDAEPNVVDTLPSMPGAPAAFGLRFKTLLGVALFLAILVVRLLPADPMAAKQMQSLLHSASAKPADFDTNRLRDDPALNEALPADAVGRQIRAQAPPSRVGYLLVPVGNCGSCIAVDLHAWQQDASKVGLSLVLLSSATPQQGAQFMRDQHIHVPFISDPDGAMLRHMNVIWMARPYLFSPDWRLRWVSTQYQIKYSPLEQRGFKEALTTQQ